MKRVNEKELGLLRGLCVIIALAAGTLSVLYLTGILQGSWCLDFILGLGILFHGALAVLQFAEHRNFGAGVAAILAVFYLAALVYFHI